ncbi:MAG: DNA mismatch repair protein MutS [Lachnospiraceae bacterium]|nr:DNA mismatch repair protein MutS [Lachnospiraceae bacterium]
MMAKYIETKLEYPDAVLFYRLGDFYEMFFDDAVTASRELELTLTGKSCGLEERAPMCGIPYHAADGYIDRLVGKGYRVAICEQVEDPKLAKGLVKREVIRVVTPGTNMNLLSLDESKNNYLMCIAYSPDTIGLSICDVSTGEYYVTELEKERLLYDEIFRFSPAEIVYNESFLMSGIDISDLVEKNHIAVSSLPSKYFNDNACEQMLCNHFKIQNLSGLGLQDYPTGTVAAGALLEYLVETQKNSLEHITNLKIYTTGQYMIIDSSSRRNLELVETMRDKQKRGSLLWVLDKTKTAMGARFLRNMVEQPLLSREAILRRQDAIEALNNAYADREELREYLGPVYDFERIMSKVATQTVNPRDLLSLKQSLHFIPDIKRTLYSFQNPLLTELADSMDELRDVYQLIEDGIHEEPPLVIREGGIIKDGFHEEVDRLRQAKREGKNWLAAFEGEEKERTGIKNLRVKYNKIFGYTIEVTNSYLSLVPEEYIRKQTLSNMERYTTEKLKQLEDTILGAEDKLYLLEYDLFCQIRNEIADHMVRIQDTAHAIARMDAILSLAYVAEQNSYVRPKINTQGVIDIKNGRHPVVEKMLKHDLFIANDTLLDNQSNRISIITGPNMAGKSTYMRQTALIVLMAQIGSFVPASEANIGIVDRIFTRVGASDDLASGQSTFMVEMNEVANILRHATSRSLIILDEIGRGTSTFDGLSIAWAVVEHIANPKTLGAKTLFATHYHELTELEGSIQGVNNYCIAVKEQGEDIVFLRKIIPGGADRSYGIQVAKLAGVPEPVLQRAKELVEELSHADISAKAREIAKTCGSSHSAPIVKQPLVKEQDSQVVQLSMFDLPKEEPVDSSKIYERLLALDISTLTPLEALNTLYELQRDVKKLQ